MTLKVETTNTVWSTNERSSVRGTRRYKARSTLTLRRALKDDLRINLAKEHRERNHHVKANSVGHSVL